MDDRERTPPTLPEATDETPQEVRDALEIAREAAEGIAQGARQAQAFAETGAAGTGELGAASVLSGTGTALGAAERVAALAGADAAVQQVIGVASQAVSVGATAYEAGEAIVEAAEAIIAELLGEAAQSRVSYELECEAASDAGWRVREVQIDEALNRPYRARLVLVSESSDALPTNLLGQDCRLRIRRGEQTSRWLNGLVSRVDHGERAERHMTTTIEVVPALDVLRHVHDSRIFQDLTVLEIIDAFVGEHLRRYDREIRIEATGTYLQREYCVQYQESALDFFHRLCEEEGLTYSFDQTGAKEALVVVDDNAGFTPAALLPSAADVPFVAHQAGDIARAEPVYALTAADQLGPTSLTLADFDWTADVLPFSSEERSRDVRDREREQYEHGGTLVAHYDTGNRRYTERDVRARVLRGRERQALTTFEYRGRGAVIGFVPGTVFTLSGHPESTLDGEYLLIAVRHRGREAHAGDPRRPEDGPEYENEFTCIPSAVPHRPQRATAKPRIPGVQTAVVVGPSGEEVWTDEQGRIRIQLHWDRQGTSDERSACWVRVMQSWAGPGFGTMFIPRIGMEVVVTFVDGDPDRPLVTGCVYNSTNVPPLTLPDDKTQSVVRTKSSIDSEGWNELRFEDKSGSERIYVHAQRDLTERVLHDHDTKVERNQSLAIDGDQTETVGGDQTSTVRGDRTVTIEKNEERTVQKALTEVVGADHLLSVQENQRLVTGGRRDVTVAKEDVELFHAGRDITVERHDNLHVVAANRNVEVGGQHNVTADEHCSIRVASSSELFLKAGVLVKGQDRVKLESGDALVEVRPQSVTIDAPAEIRLRCGNSSITLTPSGVTIEAPEITLSADPTSFVKVASGSLQAQTLTGTVAIDGLMVRIN